MRGEELGAHLHPFVESLEQRDGKRIAQTPVSGAVIDGVVAEFLSHIIGVEIVIARCLIGFVDAAVVVELDRMDEARHRNVFVLEPHGVFLRLLLGCEQTVDGFLAIDFEPCLRRGGVAWSGFVSNLGVVGSAAEGLGNFYVAVVFLTAFAGTLHCLILRFAGSLLLGGFHRELLRLNLVVGHAHLTVEAEAVALREEEVLVVVSIPVALEHGGYLRVGVALIVHLGVGDVVVIGDTTVLGDLLMQR